MTINEIVKAFGLDKSPMELPLQGRKRVERLANATDRMLKRIGFNSLSRGGK